jgi:thiosulfate dehydrogenase [quinone] large subunit
MNKNSLFFLRLSMGINFFGHGLVRLAKLQDFADGMVKGFEKSWLPEFLYRHSVQHFPFWNFP